MARILYGVMGNTHGHVVRSTALARRLPQHEFYFVGGGRVPAAVQGLYPCHEVPVLRTVHKNQKVDVPAVIGQIARRVAEIPAVTRGIRDLIRSWKPDLVICDREFFTPLAARRAGVPCISLNHSHVLMETSYEVPSPERVSWLLAMINDHILFDRTRHNLVISFYHPPVKERGHKVELFGPVLRPEVTARQGTDGEHVLVYQTSATFGRLIETLKTVPRPVIVYGFRNEAAVEGNITFRPYHAERILDDLASCAYAVVNGGHNLISEALYFGKPVLCFPIATLFEQFLNAAHIRELGYGDYAVTKEPDAALFERFEQRLPDYKRAVQAGSFDATGAVVDRVDQLARNPSLVRR